MQNAKNLPHLGALMHEKQKWQVFRIFHSVAKIWKIEGFWAEDGSTISHHLLNIVELIDEPWGAQRGVNLGGLGSLKFQHSKWRPFEGTGIHKYF